VRPADFYLWRYDHLWAHEEVEKFLGKFLFEDGMAEVKMAIPSDV